MERSESSKCCCSGTAFPAPAIASVESLPLFCTISLSFTLASPLAKVMLLLLLGCFCDIARVQHCEYPSRCGARPMMATAIDHEKARDNKPVPVSNPPCPPRLVGSAERSHWPHD